MRRLFLSATRVGSDDASLTVQINLTRDHPVAGQANTHIRFSPIFAVNEADYPPELPRHFLFLFTTDTFRVVGELTRTLKASSLASRIHVSHGLASVILLAYSDIELAAFKEVSPSGIIGFEHWAMNGSFIDKRTLSCPALIDVAAIPVPTSLLDREDEATFTELATALHAAQSFASSYLPEYVASLRPIETLARALLARMLLLTASPNAEPAALALIADLDDEFLADLREEISDAQRDARDHTILLHQLRDEAIQTAAILRSVNAQGFRGTISILESAYEAGDFSLLGLGSAYAGLLSLYKHIRDVFAAAQIDRIVSEQFSQTPSPLLPRSPWEFGTWSTQLRKTSGVNRAISPPKREAYHHLLYFSNRLGYRETKLSISAAYLSITEGYLPTWTFSTFSHEFLHAHVRSLFHAIFPLADTPTDPRFAEAYAAYEKRKDINFTPSSLLQFCQVVALDAVHQLYCFDATSADERPVYDALDATKIAAAQRKYFPLLNELAVHVLDFNYFFGGDVERYVSSIWASWSSLPVSVHRFPEYLLRTFATVGASITGNVGDRYEWCLANVPRLLEGLATNSLIHSRQLRLAIANLSQDDVMRRIQFQFHACAAYVEVVQQLFVAPSVKTALFMDPEPALQADESYSYEFVPGVFEERRVASPIGVLLDIKRATLPTSSATYDAAEAQFLSLWALTVLSSALHRPSAEGE